MGAVGKPEAFAWRLTDHCCRACFGRVLARETFEHKRLYRCSNCGVEAVGASEAAICACGIKLGRKRRDAGIRCVPNPTINAECVSEIVAQQVVMGGRPVAAAAGRDDDADGGDDT